MSRPHSHANKSRSNPNPNFNNTTRTDWTAEDDLIAPSHVSASISSLQRWAHATAHLPSHGYHWKEAQIAARIQRRYESGAVNPNAPFPRFSNSMQPSAERHEKEKKTSQDELYGSLTKRKHSISPPPTSRAALLGFSAESHIRHGKRRRTRSPSPGGNAARRVVDLTGEDEHVEYAQSSEWSFPGSDDEGPADMARHTTGSAGAGA
jgi:hypothetical protein